MAKHKAVLLIGPTGSGKTPLGELLEQNGLWGTKCFHVDFGRALRDAADGKSAASLTSKEIEVVRRVLISGELLEDEEFDIARKILSAFVAAHSGGDDGLIVLNGLPRHVGQAKGIEPDVNVELVVELACPHHTALERIRVNAGGDRVGRLYDHPEMTIAKRERFQQRTAPLLDHYRSRGVRIEKFHVTVTTTAQEIWDALNQKEPLAQGGTMKIEHAAWMTEAPVAAADWYVTHLGMKVVRSGGPPANARFLADSTGRVLLEIYNNPKVKVPDYRRMDPLILHLAFVVENVAVERDRLAAAGASVVDAFTKAPTGDDLAMLRDPWGFPLQLIKRAQPM